MKTSISSNSGTVLVLGDKINLSCSKKLKLLIDAGWGIVSSGSIANSLHSFGLDYYNIPSSNDYPAKLSGREMLNLKIISGLIADRGDLDMEAISDLSIDPIDIAFFNIKNISSFFFGKENPSLDDLDVNLITYLKYAVLNSSQINIIVDYKDIPLVVEEMKGDMNGEVSLFTRELLAKKAIDLLAGCFTFLKSVTEYKAKRNISIFRTHTR